MRYLSKFILVFSLAGLVSSFAETKAESGAKPAPPSAPMPISGGQDNMNGISLNTYTEFWNKWQFVTSRYRKDTGEIRFTYANKIAWKALSAHSLDYPDGAVFGKVSVKTEDDPAFASSAVPSGTMRIQLMVRDKKKYKDTDGWGYALFDKYGETFKDQASHDTAQACAACHEVVVSRGYVFSQPIAWAGFEKQPNLPVQQAISTLQFTTEEISVVPEAARKRLPPSFTKIRMLQGPMRDHAFAGTYNELRPALIKESLQSKLPAGFFMKEGPLFLLVHAITDGAGCKLPNGHEGVVVENYGIEMRAPRTCE